ncbi:hypothetical protein KUV28_21760, partial [Ferrimonas balearica]|nr:hypothetical protein [Ferrimonas balearica]
EQGAFYLPDDTTCFQDAAATIPAGEGDPVGFMLDNSQGASVSGGVFTGLGSDLLNGDSSTFTSGLGDWSYYTGAGTAVATGGVFEGSGGVATYRNFPDGVPLEVGAVYLAEYDWTKSTSDLVIGVGDRGSAASQVVAGSGLSGSAYGLFQATFTQAGIYFSSGAGTITIDNLRYRKLPGYHATQSSADSRPTLQRTAGGLWYLDFDGVDDSLAATLGVTSKNWTAVIGCEASEANPAAAALSAYTASTNRAIIYPNDSVTGSGGVRLYISGSAVISEAGANLSVSPQVITTRSQSGDHSVRRDGVSVGTSANSLDAEFVNVSVGDYEGGQEFEGAVFGIAIVEGKLTGSLLDATEALLATRSGVTL